MNNKQMSVCVFLIDKKHVLDVEWRATVFAANVNLSNEYLVPYQRISYKSYIISIIENLIVLYITCSLLWY